MAAYLIANITVTDPDGFAAYRQRVPPVIAQFGGRYLVRGGAIEPVEGDPGLDRLVILEFPSMEMARRFYDGPEYRPLREMRQRSSVSHVALVEGWSPDG